jgi:hypothetical protein
MITSQQKVILLKSKERGLFSILILVSNFNFFHLQFAGQLNNFLFDDKFLINAVDWNNIFRHSGKFFFRPGPGLDGVGYVRVRFDVIEHAMAMPSMSLEKDAFSRHIESLRNGMVFPERDFPVQIPLGFNPDYNLNGTPTTAMERIRRRLLIKARLDKMHQGTPEGTQDPLYLCMLQQRNAVLNFVQKIEETGTVFPDELPDGPISVDFTYMGLMHITLEALRSVSWEIIPYLGNRPGFVFVFNPYLPVGDRFVFLD